MTLKAEAMATPTARASPNQRPPAMDVPNTGRRPAKAIAIATQPRALTRSPSTAQARIAARSGESDCKTSTLATVVADIASTWRIKVVPISAVVAAAAQPARAKSRKMRRLPQIAKMSPNATT